MMCSLQKYEKAGLYAAAVLIAVVLMLSEVASTICKREKWSGVRFAVELGRHDDTTRGLLTGYNYYLLEKFAEDEGLDCELKVSSRSESYLDSLLRGSVDLVAVPAGDSLKTDSLIFSIMVDSMSVWMIREGDSHMLSTINEWIEKYHSSDEYSSTRQLFLDTYDPIRRARSGVKSKVISPYDDLLKEYADSLDWDWRFLAAIVYQESRFRLGLTSRKGAQGLMQLTPRTADHLGVGDMQDPHENLAAGTRYLGMLYSRYGNIAANKTERLKLTLAAYNAGAGRMRDCINYARLKGVDPGTWDNIASIIPDMNDESIKDVDTVKLGVFKGVETRNYVQRVMDLYGAFCTICPE